MNSYADIFYGTIRCQMLGQSTSFAVRLAYTSRITVDDFHNATVVEWFPNLTVWIG